MIFFKTGMQLPRAVVPFSLLFTTTVYSGSILSVSLSLYHLQTSLNATPLIKNEERTDGKLYYLFLTMFTSTANCFDMSTSAVAKMHLQLQFRAIRLPTIFEPTHKPVHRVSRLVRFAFYMPLPSFAVQTS